MLVIKDLYGRIQLKRLQKVSLLQDNREFVVLKKDSGTVII